MRIAGLLLAVLLVALSAGAADQTFEYDNNGNLVRRTVDGVPTDFVFDGRDKLVEVRQGSSILVRYQYDSEGRMILKIGQEGVRQYIYDGQIHPSAEYDGDGGLVALYSWAGSRLNSVSFRAGPSLVTYYPSFDALGSVVALTDASGAVVARYHYDAWGKARFPEEFQVTPNRFGFTGHRWQPETGLYSAGARQFDPGLGRFLSQDPFPSDITNPFTLHRYVYARNSPTRYTDPFGLWEWDKSLGAEMSDAQLEDARKNGPAAGRVSAQRALEGRKAFRAASEQASRAAAALPEGEDRARAERAIAAYGTENDTLRDPEARIIGRRAATPDGSKGVAFSRRTVVSAEDPDPSHPGRTNVAASVQSMDLDPTYDSEGNLTTHKEIRARFRPTVLAGGGDSLAQIVAHEGSHVADHRRLGDAVAAEALIVTEAAGGAGVTLQPAIHNPAINITKYETETEAYRVSTSIAEGQYLEAERRRPGSGAERLVIRVDRDHVLRDERWGAEERAANRDRAIREFLAVPRGDGGYGLTPNFHGRRLSGEFE